jgi:hypothetical protein
VARGVDVTVSSLNVGLAMETAVVVLDPVVAVLDLDAVLGT